MQCNVKCAGDWGDWGDWALCMLLLHDAVLGHADRASAVVDKRFQLNQENVG